MHSYQIMLNPIKKASKKFKSKQNTYDYPSQDCKITILNLNGGNTPQSTNYTATCLPSRKLSKLDEPATQNTAGGAGTSS